MPNEKTNSVVRPPVIVVMGHIDHGKSTLLDYIRQSNVVASEAGGITQAVSAYEVLHHSADGSDHRLTFIDTPGHAAFTGMRERGANIADLAILVVSAEDGVKPQTLEALAAIKSARIPFVVAINKIDKPNANVDRAKQQLAEAEILVEGYGGQIPVAAISAKTGQGVPDLLELLVLATQVENLSGDPLAPASGFILETHLDPRTGIKVNLIIKNGTLHTGDTIVTGITVGKVKRLNNFLGQATTQLTFSSPAEVIGFTELPPVGAPFLAFDNKKEAETYALEQKNQAAKKLTAVEKLNEHATEGVATLPIMIKADVAGAAQAVEKEIRQLNQPTVSLKIIGSEIGPITENDVKSASGESRADGGAGSIILGFNVSANKIAQDTAEKLGVEIKTFDIIYKLTEWLAEEIERRRPRQEVEEVIGRARLLKIFSQTGNKQIVGGVVLEGRIADGKIVKILRRDTEIGQGKIVELQEQRARVKEVLADKQFGAAIETKVTLAASDQLVASDLVTK